MHLSILNKKDSKLYIVCIMIVFINYCSISTLKESYLVYNYNKSYYTI